MAKPRAPCVVAPLIAATLFFSCVPTRDLEATASGTLPPGSGGADASLNGSGGSGTSKPGSGGVSGDARVATGGVRGNAGSGTTSSKGGSAPGSGGSAATGGATTTPSGGAAGSDPGGSGGAVADGGAGFGSGGSQPTTGGATVEGGSDGMSGSDGASGSESTGGSAATGGTATAGAGSVAPDLPDLPDSPVSGGITYSDGASWDVDGVQVPAFEVHTPTASYWLLKAAAAIVEITDTEGRKWISFSSGYRPNRGLPNLGGCCQPGDPATLGMPEMTTVLDEPSLTLSHMRLVSMPVNGDDYWLVWDFYLTHLTVTINRAEEPFGFTYHGVPGGNLDPDDQLVLSTGTAQSASTAFAADLPGPVEWAYLTSPSASANSALFLMLHGDDSVPESYGVADGNSSKFVFGGGKLAQTPIRFSVGVVDSVDDATIRERVGFVEQNIPSL